MWILLSETKVPKWVIAYKCFEIPERGKLRIFDNSILIIEFLKMLFVNRWVFHSKIENNKEAKCYYCPKLFLHLISFIYLVKYRWEYDIIIVISKYSLWTTSATSVKERHPSLSIYVVIIIPATNVQLISCLLIQHRKDFLIK